VKTPIPLGPSRIRFPDPRITSRDGLLAIGGDLEPETLVEAYRQGVFPWPMAEDEGQRVFGESLPFEERLLWFSPLKRAVLVFSELHLPRSLARFLKRHGYRLSVDEAFPWVIDACAEAPRPGQDGTWITPEMRDAYVRLHELGYAHSVEVWDPTGLLVGGIYGMEVEGRFSGESMFHRVPNASKLALLHLMECLKGRGILWMDIQMLTPHLKALGAREISREEYLTWHSRARS
jgi:leucyl/phenylalanyl-tRNA--protein transferase